MKVTMVISRQLPNCESVVCSVTTDIEMNESFSKSYAQELAKDAIDKFCESLVEFKGAEWTVTVFNYTENKYPVISTSDINCIMDYYPNIDKWEDR